MISNNRCQVCGGDLIPFPGGFIKCKYCGQVYTQSGDLISEEIVYRNAIGIMQNNTSAGYKTAYKMFKSVSGYQDSEALAAQCLDFNKSLEVQIEAQKVAQIRHSEVIEKKKKENAEKVKKIFIITGIVVVALSIVIVAIIVGTILALYIGGFLGIVLVF